MRLCMPSFSGPGRLDAVRGDIEDEDDVVGVNPGDLAVGDLVVGQKPLGARKPGAKTGIRGLPNPTELSEAEWREHMIAHLP